MEPLDPAPGPPEVATTAERAALAERALRSLPVDLREVVALRLYEGLDYAAIGRVVGVGEATARGRMRYAPRALREALADPT